MLPTRYNHTLFGKVWPIALYPKAMRRIIFKVREGQILISYPRRMTVTMVLRELERVQGRLKKWLEKEPPIAKKYFYLFGNKVPKNSVQEVEEHLKKSLSDYLKKRVPYYETVMKISPQYRISIRNMTTRLGTNSRRTKRLTFALKLAHFDPAVIDAIIVHELTHHFHFDHSPSFYRTLLRFYPDYRRAHDKIKQGFYQ